MEKGLTVKVTEFDNLRSEYMRCETTGEDCVGRLEAQLMSEYQTYLEEDEAMAEDYLAEGKALIRQLTDWAASDQHRIDTEFVASTLQRLDEEVRRQSFPPEYHYFAWVYLAGSDYVCLHYGDDTDNVRLVYTREGVEECIIEAVRMQRVKREAREAEERRTIERMQNALQESLTNKKRLYRRRLRRSFSCSMLGNKATFLEETIKEVATGEKGTKGKGYDPELNQKYKEFIVELAKVTTPLVMAGDGKTVDFRFELSIPKKGEIEVSWNTTNSQHYLYTHYFMVEQDYSNELRTWWATSRLLEMKRLTAFSTKDN